MSWRRFFARTLLCVVLGLATTVAIAWWSAIRPHGNLGESGFVVSEHCYWGAYVSADSCRTHVYVRHPTILIKADPVETARQLSDWSGQRAKPLHVATTFDSSLQTPKWIPTWAMTRIEDCDPTAEKTAQITFHGGGWPWRALAVEFRRTGRDSGWGSLVVWRSDGAPWRPRGGIIIRGRDGTVDANGLYDEPIALPLLPIWRGLLLNTTLYTTAWAATIAAFLAILRARRRRRGLCPSCAYDLRDDLARGCSECGWNRAAAQSAEPSSPLA